MWWVMGLQWQSYYILSCLYAYIAASSLLMFVPSYIHVWFYMGLQPDCRTCVAVTMLTLTWETGVSFFHWILSKIRLLCQDVSSHDGYSTVTGFQCSWCDFVQIVILLVRCGEFIVWFSMIPSAFVIVSTRSNYPGCILILISHFFGG